MKSQESTGNSSGRFVSPEDSSAEDELSKVTISSFQAKEEEIEKKKLEVRERVERQLARAEDEARRLSHIWGELEDLTADPMRKELAMIRKKVDVANKDLKSLGQSCQKKEKEYREAMELYNEKNKEKAHLVATLMEFMTESERMRMEKLEELGKTIESIQ